MTRLFAVSAPGLEPFTAQELGQLGLRALPFSCLPGHFTKKREVDDEAGGVEFEGTLRDVYRANLHLRTASRVLVRLGAFYSAGFPELRRKASHLSWEDYLSVGQAVAIRVTCHKSRLYHQRAVAERVAGAIGDRLGKLPVVQRFSEEADDLPRLIIVRLVGDHCTISADSSGGLLHRRGYRLAITKAPVRETLAAGMLLASGWDRSFPLIDPFCGSGTIPIEAALLARGIPPGRWRKFAFMEWPNFDVKTWERVLADAEKSVSLMPHIVASDRDAGAIEVAQANAERAGVGSVIEFSRRAISAIEPPANPGWIVTNPPYGVRVGADRDLRNLYAQLGKVLRLKCLGWRVVILSSSLHLLLCTGLDFGQRISLMNGGLRVKLAIGKIG